MTFDRAGDDVGMNSVPWTVDLLGLAYKYLRFRRITGEISQFGHVTRPPD